MVDGQGHILTRNKNKLRGTNHFIIGNYNYSEGQINIIEGKKFNIAVKNNQILGNLYSVQGNRNSINGIYNNIERKLNKVIGDENEDLEKITKQKESKIQCLEIKIIQLETGIKYGALVIQPITQQIIQKYYALNKYKIGIQITMKKIIILKQFKKKCFLIFLLFLNLILIVVVFYNKKSMINQLKRISLVEMQLCFLSSLKSSNFNNLVKNNFKNSLYQQPIALFSTDHIYKNKTTKQIEQQIAMQKWKNLQNTFKALNSNFGLVKPTGQQLNMPKYAQPTKIQYSLQNLRQCSRSYQVYLYIQIQKNTSPFHELIAKIVDNLWKAQQKQTLDFLQFLYCWDYKKIDVQHLHQMVISRFDLSMQQLFTFLKRYDGRLHNSIQLKILDRIEKADITSNQYNALLRIVNYFTINKILSEPFYYAVTNVVSQSINKIPPGQALQAYVYYTYNINEHVNSLQKEKKDQTQSVNQSQNKENKEQDLGRNIVNIIQNRILSSECIKFYNGEQIVALIHTFLKNNLILKDQSNSQQYARKIDKIINKIELSYYAADFSTRDKRKLLQICGLLPSIKKQSVIALVQSQFLKKQQKFDYKLLPCLYLISYQNNMLTQQIKTKIEYKISQNIFQLDKSDIARVLWLFAQNYAKNINSLHSKVQTIIEGGLNQFKIQDVSIIVWSMCASNFKQKQKFWNNIQYYLIQQFQRLKRSNQKQQIKTVQKQQIPKQSLKSKQLINECSWILWAYHNNRELGLQLVGLISQIIISEYSNLYRTAKLNLFQLREMTTFQITSIISFYYSVDFPVQSVITEIKNICLQQFKKIYNTMESIQLCKCLKYLGPYIWKDKNITNGILQIFETQTEQIAYRDIITVVGTLVASGIKSKKVTILITKLMERKKRLESLQNLKDQTVEYQKQTNEKPNKWRFPF